MLKDLIVNLALHGSYDPTAEYALSIAQAFDAHIAGVAYAFKPVIPAGAAGGLATGIIDGAIAEGKRAATIATERFGDTAKQRDLSVEIHAVTAQLTEAAAHFGAIARRFDLSIVEQRHPHQTEPEDLFLESALFSSGRPVIVVPTGQQSPAKFGRVLCCWDGSRTAVRAIADAGPFLHKADEIDLLVVTQDKTSDVAHSADEFVAHLARHGLDADVRKITAPNSEVADIILSYASDCLADLLVLGGYGHSRWREIVLGGVTREILARTTIPALLSH